MDADDDTADVTELNAATLPCLFLTEDAEIDHNTSYSVVLIWNAGRYRLLRLIAEWLGLNIALREPNREDERVKD